MMQYIRVAMRVPNSQNIYAPSKKSHKNNGDNLLPCGNIKVSFEPDGVSNPKLCLAFANAMDCYYIREIDQGITI